MSISALAYSYAMLMRCKSRPVFGVFFDSRRGLELDEDERRVRKMLRSMVSNAAERSGRQSRDSSREPVALMR